jgi:arylsulfatase A-like enzyme
LLNQAKREPGIVTFLVCLTLGICVSSCDIRTFSRKVRPPKEPANIIILLVDALRADRLHDYGNSRNTDPFLSAFGKKGVRFSNAYSHSSHTKISIASLFTGLLPTRHKVRNAGKPSRENKEKILSDILSLNLNTLADVLNKEGYLTAGLVTNPHLRGFLGFSQGFDEYRYFDPNTKAKQINKEVMSLLKDNSERPFFLYVHYMDVHSPYKPPREYKYLYTEETRLRAIGTNGPLRRKIPREIVEYTKSVYDAQINYWDDCFSELIKNLGRGGYLNNTLIVVLADHGEEFYDHGGFGHGYSLYEEGIRIPLYMVFPDHIPGENVWKNPVQVIDIFPTVCHFAKVDPRNLGLRGTNIFSNKWKEKGENLIIYSETYRGKIPRSVKKGKLKLIFNSKLEDYELYDLKNDPKEEMSIYRMDSPQSKRLQAELFMTLMAVDEGIEAESVTLDRETVDQLRSIGYLQ